MELRLNPSPHNITEEENIDEKLQQSMLLLMCNKRSVVRESISEDPMTAYIRVQNVSLFVLKQNIRVRDGGRARSIIGKMMCDHGRKYFSQVDWLATMSGAATSSSSLLSSGLARRDTFLGSTVEKPPLPPMILDLQPARRR